MKLCHTAKPTNDVRHVRTENAAIRVQFVEHDVSQPLEHRCPARVIGQNSAVKHVWIRQDDSGAITGRLARIAWCVAIVDR